MAQAINERDQTRTIPHNGSVWDIPERWVQARQRAQQAASPKSRPDVQIVSSLWVRATQQTQPDQPGAQANPQESQPKKISLHKFFQDDGPVWDANPTLPDPEAPLDIRERWASMDV